MNRNEKFAVMNALHLTAEEVKIYFDDNVAKTVPLPLLLRNLDNELWVSHEFVKGNSLVGIIIDENVWDSKISDNTKQDNWYNLCEWAKIQNINGLPTSLPSLSSVSKLARQFSKVKETVRLLKLYGVDIDDFEPGNYLPSTTSGEEKVYPQCKIDASGAFSSASFYSKGSPNRDIVRLVAKWKK